LKERRAADAAAAGSCPACGARYSRDSVVETVRYRNFQRLTLQEAPEAVPAGRMPIMTVAALEDLPPYTDTRLATPPGRTHMYFSGTPLRPFGFGLSYAQFEYSALSVAPAVLRAGDAAFNVSARLACARGARAAADEVTLLFGAFDGPSVGAASVPRLQLLAFTRTHALKEGDAQTVSFVVDRAALSLVPPEGGLPVVSTGNWTLWIGGGPPDNAQFGGGNVLQGWIAVE